MSKTIKIVIALAAIAAFRMAMAPFTELLPEEAYYWTYAKNLSLSYFDHPNMVANFIYVFTLISDSEIFVRLGAIVLSFLTAFMGYKLASYLFDEGKGAVVALVYSLAPIALGTGFIMTPDAPLYFFWTLTMYFAARACLPGSKGESPDARWWYAAGIALGCAFSSKYTSAFLFGATGLYLLLSTRNRKMLASKEVWAAVVLAFIVFAPVIIWNYQNDWASFKFQTVERAKNAGKMNFKSFGFFFAAQVGMTLPFIGHIVAGIFRAIKRVWTENDERFLFLLCFSVPMICFFAFSSLNKQAKMNWAGPAYLAAFIIAVGIYGDRWKWFFRISIAALALLMVVGHLYLVIPISGMPMVKLFTGWKRVGERIEQKVKTHPAGPDAMFIVGCGMGKYQVPSEVNFYSKRAAAVISVNAFGQKALEFDYLVDPKSLIGKDAIIVYDMSDPPDAIDWKLTMFESVIGREVVPIMRDGKPAREFMLIYCKNYLGPPELKW